MSVSMVSSLDFIDRLFWSVSRSLSSCHSWKPVYACSWLAGEAAKSDAHTKGAERQVFNAEIS